MRIELGSRGQILVESKQERSLLLPEPRLFHGGKSSVLNPPNQKTRHFGGAEADAQGERIVLAGSGLAHAKGKDRSPHGERRGLLVHAQFKIQIHAPATSKTR